MKYDFAAIEKKWQKSWEARNVFAATDDYSKPKYYALVEFPYPSGQGLHVGHPRSYTALDIVARKRRLEGYNVLYPMGWDAFGLPTENYAIKNHIHPEKVTHDNVQRFKSQLKSLGLSFDWNREINTTDPDYYKWTQWIFLQLFKKGLAYKKEMSVNWCTGCKVVLANEEVVGGVCERCGERGGPQGQEPVDARASPQYAQRLLDDLDTVDYIDRVKVSAAQLDRPLDRRAGGFRHHRGGQADRLYHPPGHPVRRDLHGHFARAPLRRPVGGQDLQHGRGARLPGGVARRSPTSSAPSWSRTRRASCSRASARINPVNGAEIPIFISDYVLMTYGTGAIMAVPAHDTRDWEFAKKFGLPIVEVVKGGNVNEEAFTDCETGVMVNSGMLDGLLGRGGEEEDHRLARRKRKGRAEGELQAARLGLLPPAVLGGADPDHPLRPLRLCARSTRASCRCACPRWTATSRPKTAIRRSRPWTTG